MFLIFLYGGTNMKELALTVVRAAIVCVTVDVINKSGICEKIGDAIDNVKEATKIVVYIVSGGSDK
jgi:hypothetical protein